MNYFIQQSKRFLEIDLLRGISVLSMVIYHAVWNLAYFQFVGLDMRTSVPVFIGRTIGSSFLGIMGLCLYLSYSRVGAYSNRGSVWKKFFLRGMKILGWATLIFLVTSIATEGGAVFGILHLIAVSVITAPLFVSRPILAGLLGVFIIGTSSWFANLPVKSVWLLPLGIGETPFYMVDYYPIFPWFGVVLLGILLGSILYPHGQRKYPNLTLGSSCIPVIREFIFLGRHALAIYIIHQPVLFTLTYIIAIRLG